MAASAYIQGALQVPDHFKITFLGVVEKEKLYPALVDAAHDSFGLLSQVVCRC